MPNEWLASRVFEGNILELFWNGEDGENCAYVKMIDWRGENVVACDSIADARDIYMHTSLYVDLFEQSAPDWQSADAQEYALIGMTTLVGLA